MAENAAELEELLVLYPNLRALDLSGSDCTEEIAAFAADHPELSVSYTVRLDGKELRADSESIVLSRGWNAAELREKGAFLPGIREVKAESGRFSLEECRLLRELWPEARLHGGIAALNGVTEQTAETLDLRECFPEAASEAVELCAFLPELKKILLPEEGETLWPLSAFTALQAAAPRAVLHGSFLLFDQCVNGETETLEYKYARIGNEGLEEIRAALPFLHSCHRLLLQDCGIDYDKLDALRSEFPEKGIAWRVHVGWESFYTDDERIWLSRLTDENCGVLRYCHDVRYLDVGHNRKWSDVTVLEDMPELEVAILAMTQITNIEPLRNCKKLEYLEIFACYELSDLSPLTECKELQHLSIANNPLMTDVSCLAECKKLRRLRIFWNKIPRENLEELKKALPDCAFLTDGSTPTNGTWRINKPGYRYYELLQQLHYGGRSPYAEIDRQWVWDNDIEEYQAFTCS